MIVYDNSNSILKSLLFQNHHKEHLVLLHVSASKLLASTNEDPYPNQANKEAEESLKQKNQPCWSKLEGCVFAINSVLIKNVRPVNRTHIS